MYSMYKARFICITLVIISKERRKQTSCSIISKGLLKSKENVKYSFCLFFDIIVKIFETACNY